MSTKDWIEKDYYKVLGVSSTASAADIKKAYRKLAKEFHPDSNVGDAAAEEKFKGISEAYDVLSSDSKRGEYDDARRMFAAGGRPGGFGGSQSGASGPDLGSMFGDSGLGDLLGGMFGGGGSSGGRRRSGPARGADLETTATIGFHDAWNGATISLPLRSEVACGTCAGSGAKPGTSPRTCAACNGSGSVNRNAGGFGFAEPCRQCRGQGRVIDSPCGTCGGNGRVLQTRTINVRVPAGVKNAARIRLPAKGAAGERGGSAGDLYVVVTVVDHPIFSRSGDNLTLTVPVTFDEATLGAKIAVPTPDGVDVAITLKPGTSSGKVLRMKGKGFRKKDGSHGDLLVTIEVAVPQKLSTKAKEALEAYAEATADHDPRENLRAYTTTGSQGASSRNSTQDAT